MAKPISPKKVHRYSEAFTYIRFYNHHRPHSGVVGYFERVFKWNRLPRS